MSLSHVQGAKDCIGILCIVLRFFLWGGSWQGVDIATLEEYYLIEQTFTATGEVYEYYAFLLDGNTVLQSGKDGMYSYLSQELYDELDSIYKKAVERE